MAEIELPDFDDLMQIAEDISAAKKRLVLNEAILEDRLAVITQDVSTNEDYFIKEKPASMRYIEVVYHKVGRNEDERKWLLEMRVQISGDEALVKYKEMEYNVYRDMIAVWRTDQANKRGANWDV